MNRYEVDLTQRDSLIEAACMHDAALVYNVSETCAVRDTHDSRSGGAEARAEPTVHKHWARMIVKGTGAGIAA